MSDKQEESLLPVLIFGIIIISLSIYLFWFYLPSEDEAIYKLNFERADLFLSQTWDSPYVIDKGFRDRGRVRFYSNKRYFEIYTGDMSVSIIKY